MLGLAAAAFAGVGLAAGGLDPIVAGGGRHRGPRDRDVPDRHARGGAQAARCDPQAVPLRTSRPADGRRLRSGRAGRRRRPRGRGPGGRRLGPARGATSAGNVRGWIPGSSRSSPSPRSCTWPGTSGSRRPGDPLRAATIGMLAGCVGIVPVGIAIWWLGGQPALPVEGIALGRRVGRRRGGLLHPAGGGVSTRRPVGRLPDRAWDRAAARGRHRGRAVRGAAGRGRVDRRGRAARRLPVAPAAVARDRARPAWRSRRPEGRRRERDPVRPRDRRDDRDVHRDRSDRHAPDRRVHLRRDPVADLLGRAGRLGGAGRRRRPPALRARGSPPGRRRGLADARRPTCASWWR